MRVLFLTTEAFQQQCQILPHAEELVISMEHVRYCKIESYKNATIGVIRIPETVGQRKKTFIFGCYLTEHDIIFLEEENELYQCWNGMYEHLEEVENPFQYLLMMLEELVATDIYNLQKIEKKMNGFEEELLKEKELPFFDFFMKYRKCLSELHFYYEQMMDLGEGMQTECGRMGQEELVEAWRRFSVRMERFHDYVNYLREYVLQIHELYQSKKDAKQNRILNWLTIITTLFLPLTLLTGWYGMNFTSMPEVGWEHGYLIVIAVAAMIVIAEILLIRKWKIL